MAKDTTTSGDKNTPDASAATPSDLEALKATIAELQSKQKERDDQLADLQLQLEAKGDEVDELTRIVQEVKAAPAEFQPADCLPGQSLYEVQALGTRGAEIGSMVCSGYDASEAGAKFFKAKGITDTHNWTLKAIPVQSIPTAKSKVDGEKEAA